MEDGRGADVMHITRALLPGARCSMVRLVLIIHWFALFGLLWCNTLVKHETFTTPKNPKRSLIYHTDCNQKLSGKITELSSWCCSFNFRHDVGFVSTYTLFLSCGPPSKHIHSPFRPHWCLVSSMNRLHIGQSMLV